MAAADTNKAALENRGLPMRDEETQYRDVTLSLLREFVSGDDLHGIGIRLWDGTTFPDPSPKKATIVLNHPGSLRALITHRSQVDLGEAYLYDDVDIEGDVEAIFGLEELVAGRAAGAWEKLRAAGHLLALPAAPRHPSSRRGRASLRGTVHSIERDKEAIAYHYDVSNDFYALWLDRHMVYSCAYFRTPEDTLDQAQERKLEYVCRKLRLQPGQRLLDIGCGWGGLALYAATRFGVDVTGITLSQPQVDLASQRIREAGLEDRCRVLMRDYREMSREGPFDAMVSVGMFEHVGANRLSTYFREAFDLLGPGGVFLNHGIANRIHGRRDGRPSFADAYVFPDGELTAIPTVLREAETAGFEIRDVESLREHYHLTLQRWVRRLEARHEDALKYVDEPTYRVWRLYMSGAAHGFDSGQLNVYQSLLARPAASGRSRLPLTREDWYARAS
jgi:cyclopropane-fatty-acyl-phospholipid synthase